MRKDIWGREHFQWLPEKDAYLCPADQPLRRYSNMKSTQRVRYRAPRGAVRPVPSDRNARHRGEKGPYTAPGDKSLSMRRNNCWPAPWGGSVWSREKST
jgi:hypothetical protein